MVDVGGRTSPRTLPYSDGRIENDGAKVRGILENTSI
jgi:hypothetical protein